MIQHLQNIIYSGQKIDDFDTFDILPDYLKDFFLVQNGFIAFKGGLHIRGCVKTPSWHSINESWFGDIKLSGLFDSIDINDIPIGQDCFGDQFVIRHNSVWHLFAEIDEIVDLGLNFNEFIEQIYNSPKEFLNIDLIDNINLKPGQLINVVPPFCIKADKGYSFKPIGTESQIKYLSFLSKQIKNLPNGTTIDFEIK